MKNYGFYKILFVSIFLFSSCSTGNFDETENQSVKKIQRLKVSSVEKISRFPLSIKQKAKKLDERTYTYYSVDNSNLFERYDISSSNSVYLDAQKRNLGIAPKRIETDYLSLPPVRMSQFSSNPLAYSDNSYYKDPTEKEVLGVKYNTREGYTKSAKLDQKNYQRGYVENFEYNEEQNLKGGYVQQIEKQNESSSTNQNVSEGSSSNQSSVVSDEENENQVNPDPQTEKNDSKDSSNPFFSKQGGYIESFEDKYGHDLYENSGNYLNTYDKNKEEEKYLAYLNYISPNNYLAEYPNGHNLKGAKNYLDSLGDDEKGVSKGYLENTFVSDYNDDLEFNEGIYSSYGSYLDNTVWSGGSSGYLESLGFAPPVSKGYLENYAVFSDNPNISTYSF